MSALQFEEWLVYYEMEPFGDEWLRHGILASVIANANRDPAEKPDPFLPEDFMPALSSVDDEEVEEDPDASWKRNKALFEELAAKRTP